MKVSDNFGPIYQTVVLDGSGNGAVSFQAVGSNIRLSNIFFNVSTVTQQSVCTIYKGQIASGNVVLNSNSGSTGGNATGNLDLFDGETCYVVWVGGDAGATATATFSGGKIPFGEVEPSNLQASEPFAAGDGTIIYPALKSPDFVQGVSGWRISRTGEAEFNDVIARGVVRVNTEVGDGYIEINDYANFAGIEFMPEFAVADQEPGRIFAINEVTVSEWPLLSLLSPHFDAAPNARINLFGERLDGGLPTTIELRADETNAFGNVSVDGNLTVDGDLSMDSAYGTFSGNIANNTITALTPVSLLANNHGIWTSGSSFTVQQDGTYKFGCIFRYATNVAGQRSAQLYLNGTQLVYQTNDATTGGMAGTNVTAQIETVENLVVGDVVSFRAFQNSGGTLAINYGRMWIQQQQI